MPALSSSVSRVLSVAAVVFAASAHAETVTLESLLREMTDRTVLARFPSPAYTCRQDSSYDRASTSPENPDTWFANADVSQYMRVEMNGERKEWVMMDRAGPGAVVRIWSANPKGVMRVYIDGNETPAIEAPMTDILGGNWLVPQPLAYEASKGWNLYLPIPYGRRCKITSDSDGFYYQVNYRTYVPNAVVESFTPAALAAAGPSLADVVADLQRDRSRGVSEFGIEDVGRSVSGTAAEGERVTLDLPAGSAAVTGLMIRIKGGNMAQALRSCVVEAEFDGRETIWCPVGEFFGVGAGISPYQDWYRAVGADGSLRCRWIMPYRDGGRLAIRNLGSEAVEVDVKARIGPWRWDDRSLHFYAVWRQEYPLRALGGKGTSDFNYVDIAGRGVYVGDVLSVMNPVKEWWGEGDEKIYVDGEHFPSHFGTGTEDYYGYAWCSPDLFQRPFHAQPRCDGQPRRCNWGRSTVTRSRALDAIPFSRQLRMDIEVWHWKECEVEYATAAYFYAAPGAKHNRSPQPERAALALVEPPPLPPMYKVAGAIECEGLTVMNKTEGLAVVPQGGWPDIWSEEHQLWIQGKGPGAFVELKVPAQSRGKCKLTLYATKSWDYGIVRFSVNGRSAGEVDLCNTAGRTVVATGPIELGVFEPKDGGFLLRAEVIGANPKSDGTKSYFGLDCIAIEQLE